MIHIFLILIASAWLVPMLWLVSTSLKQRTEVFRENLSLLPDIPQFDNFIEASQIAPFGTYLLNSILVNGMIVAVQLVTIMLAGYAFAKLRFPFRNTLFFVYVLQMMFPIHSTFLVNYMTLKELGLLNTLLAMAIPFFASGYGTFMVRQACLQVPREYDEVAALDRCNHLETIWHVYVPLVRPTLVAFALISVVTHWNDYFWPLLVTESDRVRTLPIGLGMLAQSESGADWTRLMAATLLVIGPLLLSFMVFQRHFVSSLVSSGIK